MYQTDLFTGKKFSRTFSVFQADGTTPRQWMTGETLRAALRETPAGAVLLTPVVATGAGGTGTIEIDETDTAKLATAPQFGTPRVYWIDVDRVDTDGNPWAFIQIKVSVKAGVTENE